MGNIRFKTDGVDYIPLPTWKIFMIQFLNIAGLGPIFGAMNNSTNDGASIVQVSDESSSSEWFILLTD